MQFIISNAKYSKTMIRIIFIITLFSGSIGAFSQDQPLQSTEQVDTANYVTFVVKFNKATPAKDGYYIGDYIVEIDHSLAKTLRGKKIKVSGYVTIEKGLNNIPKEYDSNGKEIIRQGRAENTKHILNPEIEIIR
jgi:hypothetical protein